MYCDILHAVVGALVIVVVKYALRASVLLLAIGDAVVMGQEKSKDNNLWFPCTPKYTTTRLAESETAGYFFLAQCQYKGLWLKGKKPQNSSFECCNSVLTWTTYVRSISVHFACAGSFCGRIQMEEKLRVLMYMLPNLVKSTHFHIDWSGYRHQHRTF